MSSAFAKPLKAFQFTWTFSDALLTVSGAWLTAAERWKQGDGCMCTLTGGNARPASAHLPTWPPVFPAGCPLALNVLQASNGDLWLLAPSCNID